MKYSIHGFYQPRAVELGLSNDDLLVLRWFVDFAGSKKMKTIIEEDGIYYWVNYTTVLEDLPVLRISKQTLKKKHFDNLCNSNVLKHKHIKDGGSFSYYAYGINYDTLVYLQDDTPTSEFTNPMSKFTKGYVENYAPPTSEFTKGVGKNLPNKDYSINNSSINNYSIKDNNIVIKNDSVSKSELEKEFETIWKEYPRKQGKSKALSKYISVRKKGVKSEEIIEGLKAYLYYISVEKIKFQYIKQGSTWFNQECWNDDYSIKREITTGDLVDKFDYSDFR